MDLFELLQDEFLISILERVGAGMEELASCYLVSKRWNYICKEHLSTLSFNCAAAFTSTQPRKLRKQLIEAKLCKIVGKRHKIKSLVVYGVPVLQSIMPGQKALVYVLNCIRDTIETLDFHFDVRISSDSDSESSDDIDDIGDELEIGPEMWKILSECQRLKELTLGGFTVTRKLELTRTWPLLTRIYLKCRLVRGSQLEKILALCPKLEKVIISGCDGTFKVKSASLLDMTSNGEAVIEAENLRKLYFRGSKLRLSRVDHLEHLKVDELLYELILGGLRSISTLDVYLYREEDVHILLTGMKYVTSLKNVKIEVQKNCPVGLAQLAPLLRTEELTLSFVATQNWRTLHLLKEDIPKLQRLKLNIYPWNHGYSMGDGEWVEWMTNVEARCPSLTQVFLPLREQVQLEQCLTKVHVYKRFT